MAVNKLFVLHWNTSCFKYNRPKSLLDNKDSFHIFSWWNSQGGIVGFHHNCIRFWAPSCMWHHWFLALFLIILNHLVLPNLPTSRVRAPIEIWWCPANACTCSQGENSQVFSSAWATSGGIRAPHAAPATATRPGWAHRVWPCIISARGLCTVLVQLHPSCARDSVSATSLLPYYIIAGDLRPHLRCSIASVSPH